MTCMACIERGKTWRGDDPCCAFERGRFSRDNWNCGTMNNLREAIKSTGDIKIIEDQSYALIANSGGVLYVTWYKNRGATDNAILMEDADGEEEAPVPPTEAQVLRVMRGMRP